MKNTNKVKVIIAGIAGASLGTEILKSLILADKYVIYGCDIANLAFGHYQEQFEKTFIINKDTYIGDIIQICRLEGIKYIIPGAEEPMVLLSKARNDLEKNSLVLIGNSSNVVNAFSDKEETFKILNELGFNTPYTVKASDREALNKMSYPAVVKPSIGSGGSSFVFLVQNIQEAAIYTEYLSQNGKVPIIQEYIEEYEGEYTVGVLNLPNGDLVGSIALKRVFSNKLSVMSKLKNGLISSGNSQGLIDRFPSVERISEGIASAIKSKGPINVQGRVKNGVFIPFEINPRFSASTYLRAMSGFNEIDIFLSSIITGNYEFPDRIRYGYYLRSFSEIYIDKESLKND